MSLKRRFREQLDYQKRVGRVFARNNPQLARFLGDSATDPDVDRFLEGVAFLSAKVEMKIEDDFPEITHTLLQLLWPNYLRPLPSSTILQFSPEASAITRRHMVPKGTQVLSRPVDGTPCSYRTCTDTWVHPFGIRDVSDAHTLEKSVLRVDLCTLTANAPSTYECDRLDFHLSGSDYNAQTLYLWLAKYLSGIRVESDSGVQHIEPDQIVFPGFDPQEALLPYPKNAMDGYRILQEYFLFARRFYFFGLTGLRGTWPTVPVDGIRFEFHFSRPMPVDIRLRTDDLALHCTPAVNLFAHDAEPIRLTGKAAEYPLHPAGQRADAYEIFSIDRVDGWKNGGHAQSGEWLRTYQPFESFRHQIDHERGQTMLYYRTRISDSLTEPGVEHRIAFVRGDDHLYVGREETVSLSLTCTNRNLPLGLGIGDICELTKGTPPYVGCRNLTVPTPSYRPTLDGDLLWSLISNLSPTYLSLLSIEPLKAVISTYDFASRHDLQRARATRMRLDSMRDIVTTPIDRMYKGLPIRGTRSALTLDQEGFSCEGELYLFGTVLSHFLGLYASVSSFHQLEALNTANQERYTWPMRTGTQSLI